MAQGQDVREILVKDIVVGEGQVRLRDLDKGIEELAASIRLHGLLEPIVVHSTKDGRFEVLMGQRRVLAHQRLGKTQILAVIVDRPIDETSAKTLSLTKNMVRTALNPKDVIDACGVLYRKYGSARSVAEETGLPYPEVLKHIKYDRLVPALQALVDTGEIRMDVALKAQDAAGVTDESGQKETVKLAKELSSMTVAQQRQAVKARRKDPKTPVDELVDRVTRDGGSRQITVTLSAAQHRGLQALALKSAWRRPPPRSTGPASASARRRRFALGATSAWRPRPVVVRNAKRERVIASGDFFDGHFTTTVAEDGLLEEVRIPVASPAPAGRSARSPAVRVTFVEGVGHGGPLRARRRYRGQAVPHRRGRSGLAVRGGGGVPSGCEADTNSFAAAAEASVRNLERPSNVHGSAADRSHLAGVAVPPSPRQRHLASRRSLVSEEIDEEGNGEARCASSDVRMTLAEFLRDRLELRGTHLGCEHGVCGACTVLVDGSAVRSCVTLAV